MEQFEGAIFDLVGTLLDSMGVWREIDYAFLGKRGIEVPMDYLEAITPLSFQAAAEYTISRFHLSDTPSELIKEWKDMAAYAYSHTVGLKPGVKEYLRELKKRGVKIASATSSDENLFIPCLQHNGIDGFFDAYVTVKEVRRGKGFPDVYLLAAERLGLKPEQCAVYEDILAGIEGAKMGGFYAVAVLDGNSDFLWERMKQKADRWIADFQELHHDFT